jgi:hypothetical protein
MSEAAASPVKSDSPPHTTRNFSVYLTCPVKNDIFLARGVLGPSQSASARALTLDEKAILQYGQQVLIGSEGSVMDFSKMMITVDTGLFATYFAILKFLGLGTEPSLTTLAALAFIPPLFFISSIVGFVFGVTPHMDKNFELHIPGNVDRHRKKSLDRKRKAMIVGMVLFLAGMVAMTLEGISLL